MSKLNRAKYSKRVQIVTGLVIASAMVLPLATSAQTVKRRPQRGIVAHVASVKLPPVAKTLKPIRGPRNAVTGNVASISGSILTLNATNGAVYAVDVSRAKLMESTMSGLSISNVQVGDKVTVIGPKNGTNIASKTLSDESFMGRNLFAGTVASVNGSVINLSAKNNTSYSVDASQATLTKGSFKDPVTIAVSDVKVGDRLTVNGSLNGQTVVASAIKDMGTFKIKTGKGVGRWNK